MIRRIETDEATLASVKKLLEQQLQGRNSLMQAPALSLYQRFLQDLDRPVPPTLMEVATLLKEAQEIQEVFSRLSCEGQRAAEERLSTISRQLSQWRLMLGQHLFLGERCLSAGNEDVLLLVPKKG
uniref:Uncharacterized protein n=1 Tax=Thermosporothrix sp. COM3 TaxID=2490863 RepID=A0A455SJY6_9CHLR|nr:hypothetical protein KTC_19830 [Thermosporothrix sp. COM3]